MSEESPQEKSKRGLFRRDPDRHVDSVDGRGRFLRAGLVALVVVLLVLVPAYFASQPKFLKRYDSLHPYYKTWSRSVHAKASCQSCHVTPTWTARAAYSLKMAGWLYLSVLPTSKEPDLLNRPTNEACAACHVDLRTVSVSGDLNIPHRAHVEILKMKCVQCHKFLVHEKSPEGKHKPRMATCLTCHNGRTAKNSCSACHREKATPASHRAADWVVVHAQAQGEVDCAKCHGWTKNWCADCHARRPRSHGPDWRAVHGAKVETRRNCEVCHTASFCTRCHGEVPRLNFDPAVKPVQ